MSTETPGRVAYEAYRDTAGGVSLATGDPLPDFEDRSAPIRAAWEVAARADASEFYRSPNIARPTARMF